MSELDFEAENAHLENQKPGSKSSDLLRRSSDESNNIALLKSSPLKRLENDSNLNAKGYSKVSNNISLESGTDELEEGEIEETCDFTNPAICRHYKVGKCNFAENCRFLHVTHNAYKMFSTLNPRSIKSQSPAPYCFELPPPPPVTNAWEVGLEEAKMLLKKAKIKREADVDFEEKQLYLGIEKDQTERFKVNCKIHKSKKYTHSKCKTVKEEFSRKKSSKSLINYFPNKKVYSTSWVQKKPRKKARSRSSSSSNSYRGRSCSSRCSVCSSGRKKRSFKNGYTPKVMSKLERVFSRTFRKSLSRRRSISSSLSPYRTSKGVSPLSFSSSSSSSRSEISGNYSPKNVSSNFLRETIESAAPKLSEDISSSFKKRIHSNCDCPPNSPSSVKKNNELKNSDSESSSSNMTVSSITCTSISDISDNSFIEDSPSKPIEDSVSFVNRFDTHEKYTLVVDENEKNFKTTEKNVLKPPVPDEVSLKNCCKQVKISPISFKIERKQPPNIKNVEPISPPKPKMLPKFEKVIDNKLEKRKVVRETDESAPKDTFQPSSNQQQKKRKITPAELELLKYVRNRDSDSHLTPSISVKKAVRNEIKTNPVTEPVKLTNIKTEPPPSSCKTRSLSRRELLMEQLKAVELAIARRKGTL